MRKQSGIKGVVVRNEEDSILNRVTKKRFLGMVMSELTLEIAKV